MPLFFFFWHNNYLILCCKNSRQLWHYWPSPPRLWENTPEILLKIGLSNIAFTWGKYFFLNIFLIFTFFNSECTAALVMQKLVQALFCKVDFRGKINGAAYEPVPGCWTEVVHVGLVIALVKKFLGLGTLTVFLNNQPSCAKATKIVLSISKFLVMIEPTQASERNPVLHHSVE